MLLLSTSLYNGPGDVATSHARKVATLQGVTGGRNNIYAWVSFQNLRRGKYSKSVICIICC
jgi:hypothetical protein